MLAAMFIYGGINALRAPHLHAQVAKPALDAVAPVIDKATEAVDKAAGKTSLNVPARRPDEETLVKLDGWVKIIGGTMLALGVAPRLASVALATSLVPTTYAGHRFWEENDPQRKQEQLIHFLKNAGLLGGLLIATADTEGRPSLSWRGRRAARRAMAMTAAPAAALSGTAAGVRGAISAATPDLPRRGRGARKTARRNQALAKAAKRAAALQVAASAASAKLMKKAKRRSRHRRGAALVEQATRLGHEMATRASVIGAEVAHQAGGVARDARKRVAALTGS